MFRLDVFRAICIKHSSRIRWPSVVNIFFAFDSVLRFLFVRSSVFFLGFFPWRSKKAKLNLLCSWNSSKSLALHIEMLETFSCYAHQWIVGVAKVSLPSHVSNAVKCLIRLLAFLIMIMSFAARSEFNKFALSLLFTITTWFYSL